MQSYASAEFLQSCNAICQQFMQFLSLIYAVYVVFFAGCMSICNFNAVYADFMQIFAVYAEL